MYMYKDNTYIKILYMACGTAASCIDRSPWATSLVIPMTMHTSKSKPEIECQYGGRPFSETRSSFILALA